MLEMQKTWVQYLGREDPLEEEMVTHFSIAAWRISWTEEPGGLQSMGSQRVGHEKQRHYFANKGPSSQGYGFSCDHVWM